MDNLAESENQIKLQNANKIGEAINQIELSIKINACVNELYSNYTELGAKPLEATAKLDQDVVLEINEIDK